MKLDKDWTPDAKVSAIADLTKAIYTVAREMSTTNPRYDRAWKAYNALSDRLISIVEEHYVPSRYAVTADVSRTATTHFEAMDEDEAVKKFVETHAGACGETIDPTTIKVEEC